MLYPASRVLPYIVPVFVARIPAWIFLGVWFLYQLIAANFGLFSASANGGDVAFLAHVGGFLFGLLATRGPHRFLFGLLATRGPHRRGTNRAPDAITLICEFRADPRNAPELPPCAIALADIATVSIDFTAAGFAR